MGGREAQDLAAICRVRPASPGPMEASAFRKPFNQPSPPHVVRLEFRGATGGGHRLSETVGTLTRFGDERPIGRRRCHFRRTTGGALGFDRIAPCREQHLGEGCMNGRFVLAPCDQPMMDRFRVVDRAQSCQAGRHRKCVHHVVRADLGGLPKGGQSQRRRPSLLMDLGEEQST